MRKNYTLLKTFLVLFSMAALNAGAQLSGLYTINSGAATAGTNYNNFNDFATDINTNGVSAAVTVDVVPGSGPYNEQVLFNQITGASLVNNITIEGNGELITFNSTNSNQRYVMGFNGADYFTVNNLNMLGTGTYAYVCLLYSGADYNTFSSCTFSVNANATSSNQIPVVVSGSGTTYGSASNSGSYNKWVNCDMYSGYFCFTFYGPTTLGQYNTGNQVIGCTIRDFYIYGLYTYYHDVMTIKNNIIDKATRTTLSGTTYGMIIQYTSGSLIDGNIVEKLYEQNQTITGTTYAYYILGNTNTGYGDKNVIQNNIARDIKSHTTLTGFRVYYINGDFIHNTLAIEHPNATSGTVYGVYYATTGDRYVNSENNLIYINRGGSSSKWAFYYGSTALVTSNNNNIWLGGSGSNYFAGYYSGSSLATLANLQTASSQEATTFSLDPMFVNIATNDLHPSNPSLNNQGLPLGVLFDNELSVRNQNTPDIGALEFLTPLCTGTPSTGAISGPTYSLCPGENAAMMLGNLSPDAGIQYTWVYSNVSNVGPFTTTVSPASSTNIAYTAMNVTTPGWYQVVATCTNPGGGTGTSVIPIMIAGPTQGTVPYFEDFEGIGLENRLPNCSWAASGLGTDNQTFISSQSNNRVPRSGTSFATFYNGSPGTSYYYTHPIQMNTGITYSAALWYATEYFGYNNWSELSILVGPNQSTTGLVQVASVSPALSGPYKLLDNTFTVPTSGLYYVAIKATSSNGNALYLSWDDLSITIPCDPGSPNLSPLQMSASTNTVCAGQPVNLNATGADSYMWNTGSTQQAITEYPTQNPTIYEVYGTNALTGCTGTITQIITVDPSPVVFVVADKPVSCAGEQVVLTAYGAANYAWSNASIGQNITVSPTSNTGYTVVGTSVNGCSGSYGINLTVNPLPSILVNTSNGDACKDDAITLTATGGVAYTWVDDVTNQVYQGSNITVTLPASAIFTVTGIDANGCSGVNTIPQSISECVGIQSYSQLNGLQVYPNPSTGELNVELANDNVKVLVLTDMTGRVIMTQSNSDRKISMDLTTYANGVYYLSITSDSQSEVIKVVKQ